MSRPFFAFRIQNRKDIPLAEQLAEQLLTALAHGACLQSAQQLISLREMKKISGCSLETVKKAYDMLVDQGWLTSVHGKGYFITQKLKNNVSTSWEDALVSLQDSTPVPTTDFIRHLRQAFSDSFDSLGSSPDQVGERRCKIKETFIKHEKERGVSISPKQLFLFNRSLSGFHFLLQFFIRPGETVFVEEFSYPPFIKLLTQYGLKVRSIPLDEEGLSLPSLLEAHRQEQANWLLIQPHHHFPTGISYSRKRKQELLQWAGTEGVSIIENDHHGDLWFNRPRRTLYQLNQQAGEHASIYYIHSFSKTLARELQLGLLAMPTKGPFTFEETQQFFTLAGSEPSLLVLEAVAHMLEDSWLKKSFLPERRAQYAHHWQVLQQTAKHVLPSTATLHPIRGGLNCWVSWGEETTEATRQELQLLEILREEGLVLSPGHAFRLQTEAATLRRPAVRFPLSPWGPREIQHWISRLGAAILRCTK
ncbi:PLP-dependent aminotransferase family protein [Brevibacillus sp. SYSU BS000544]|uniref:aminotransferase-like domain-containing protein n=1 Tax=Brevibacillus sp. SYSU BS000544 TaxID=3416443 RepID=UPI003CE5C0CD